MPMYFDDEDEKSDETENLAHSGHAVPQSFLHSVCQSEMSKCFFP